MTKLTDTQAVILSAASQRTDRFALPLPKSLKGGAAHKVVNALVDKGLLKEVKANRKMNDPVWRENDEGQILTLVITDAGFEAIGIQIEPKKRNTTKPEAKGHAPERKTRDGTKQSLMIELLKRPGGATLAEIVAATGWQAHTVRGAMAGALKKKLGLTITSEKNETKGRIYRID
jgi:hypothetical protein